MAASRLTEDVLPPEFFEKMKPTTLRLRFLYMCSEECQDSGMIINAPWATSAVRPSSPDHGAILSKDGKIPEP